MIAKFSWRLIADTLVGVDWVLHKWPRPFGVARWYVCRVTEWAVEHKEHIS